MSMASVVKSLFSSRGKARETKSSGSQDFCGEVRTMPAETEVNFIKTLLERKFKRKFQMRVKVEGYLDDKESDMKYTLVVDDYCNTDPSHDYHSIYGNSTKNILDVKPAFLKAYWSNVEEGINSVGKQLDNWDAQRAKRYRDVTVAKSHEELLMLATLEGI